MGDSVENIINSYSSGGILNFEYKEIFDTLASGISCMGMFTHYGGSYRVSYNCILFG